MEQHIKVSSGVVTLPGVLGDTKFSPKSNPPTFSILAKSEVQLALALLESVADEKTAKMMGLCESIFGQYQTTDGIEDRLIKLCKWTDAEFYAEPLTKDALNKIEAQCRRDPLPVLVSVCNGDFLRKPVVSIHAANVDPAHPSKHASQDIISVVVCDYRVPVLKLLDKQLSPSSVEVLVAAMIREDQGFKGDWMMAMLTELPRLQRSILPVLRREAVESNLLASRSDFFCESLATMLVLNTPFKLTPGELNKLAVADPSELNLYQVLTFAIRMSPKKSEEALSVLVANLPRYAEFSPEMLAMIVAGVGSYGQKGAAEVGKQLKGVVFSNPKKDPDLALLFKIIERMRDRCK